MRANNAGELRNKIQRAKQGVFDEEPPDEDQENVK
jgi:hypothetical protein